MKKTIIMTMAALAMASAAFAQNSAKESAAAAKQAAKELKAKQAADLKAFKGKQAADLKAFIEAQKSGAGIVAIPTLTCEEDSMAFHFGVAQSNGLKQYLTGQLGVDTTYIAAFEKSLLETVSRDQKNPEVKAQTAGAQIGGQVINMANGFKNDYYEGESDKTVDPKMVAMGLLCGLEEVDGISATAVGAELQTKVQAKKKAIKDARDAATKAEGEKFLSENKSKPGVQTTASGLQYKVITEGNGAKPTATDKVKVHYEGHLIDGTVFDSSYKRSKPAEFGVTQVIKGWTEALQMMPVGSKWELYIPYDLAYGTRDQGKDIKAYSTLIFTVELIEIVK